MNIKYNSLEKIGLETVYEVFIDAFSNYQVKLDVSFEKFSNMMKRRSVDFAVSMGIFDDNKLIGFVLNGKRTINSKLIAYDSGTGISQAYQGLKLARDMLTENANLLKKKKFDKYILEVLTSNEKAFKLYKDFGFTITREFNCFKNSAKDINEFKSNTNIKIDKIDSSDIDWKEFESYFDFAPSWQNATASIKEDYSKFSYVKAVKDSENIGYGIIEKKTGDIPLLGVNRKYRNRSIASLMLNELLAKTTSPSLSAVNIDNSCENIKCFLEKHNFINFIQQYEMVINIIS